MNRLSARSFSIAACLVASVTFVADAFASVPAPERTYAILICGGNKQSSNHLRFWGDMALAYGLMRKDMGVPKENIRLLWASGDPSEDLCIARKGGCQSCGFSGSMPLNPFDFDRDGVGDVDGAATYANVAEAFAEICARLTADDQLFVYFTDHGTKTLPEAVADEAITPFSSIKLWNGELLPDWMIGSWTRDLPCPVIVASVCCYSGALMADVLNSPGIRFVATASEYVQSYAGDTMPWFCKWSYEFFSALRGYYPKNGLEPQVPGKACDADVDGDGVTSFREAARHACRYRTVQDYPQYAESWGRCGNGLFPVATMTAEEQRDYAERHQDERRGYLGFRRMQSLKLKGGAVSPEADGVDEMALERLTVSAPPTSIGKDGTELVFQRWTVSPAGAALGSEFDIASPETAFLMPSTSLTLTPKYRDAKRGCPVTMWARTSRDDVRPEGVFDWSPDGKVWYDEGKTVVLDAGTLNLRWRSLSDAWKAPSGQTKVKLKDGESYDNRDSPATFVYVPSVSVKVTVLRADGWVDSAACGKVTSSPSSARVTVGKKVKLTAKASKGFVFSHWESGSVSVPNPGAKTLSFVQPSEDVRLTACFVTSEHDAASIALSVCGIDLAPGEGGALPTNVMCGVVLNWPVARSADSSTTVTASGLPIGLSLKHDKASDAYVISGVPSSASKKDKKTSAVKPSKVKLTVKTAGKASKTYRLDMTVLPMPAWATGSFDGLVRADVSGAGIGKSTMTIASTGKISGKFTLFGTNWTFSATGYSSFADGEDEQDRCFRLEGTAKASRKQQPVAFEVSPGWVAEDGTDWLGCASAVGYGQLGEVEMRRNIWKDAAVGISPLLDKKSLADYGQGDAYVKVSKKGEAKFSGKLADGTKLSVSSTAFIDFDETVRAWLVVPASKKYPGYGDLIEIKHIVKE